MSLVGIDLEHLEEAMEQFSHRAVAPVLEGLPAASERFAEAELEHGRVGQQVRTGLERPIPGLTAGLDVDYRCVAVGGDLDAVVRARHGDRTDVVAELDDRVTIWADDDHAGPVPVGWRIGVDALLDEAGLKRLEVGGEVRHESEVGVEIGDDTEQAGQPAVPFSPTAEAGHVALGARIGLEGQVVEETGVVGTPPEGERSLAVEVEDAVALPGVGHAVDADLERECGSTRVDLDADGCVPLGRQLHGLVDRGTGATGAGRRRGHQGCDDGERAQHSAEKQPTAGTIRDHRGSGLLDHG